MSAIVIRFPVERRVEPARVAPIGWAHQAHAVLDAAEALVAHRPDDVVALCRHGVALLAAAGPEIDDDASLAALAERLDALHRRALAATGVDTDAGTAVTASDAVAAARRRHPTARRRHRTQDAG